MRGEATELHPDRSTSRNCKNELTPEAIKTKGGSAAD
jgi:hypothetical protein